MTRRRTSLVLILAVVLAPASALGGWESPYTHTYSNNIISDWLNTRMHLHIQAAILRGALKNATAGAPATRMTFKASSSDAAESFAARLTDDPAERAALSRYLNAALAGYRRQAALIGRKNDLACAVAFFVAVSHAVARDERIPEGALEAVAGQMDGVLRSSTWLAGSGDRRLQELSDFLVCAAVFVHAGYRQGDRKHDPGKVREFRALAALNLERLLDVDPARLRLTEEGLALE